MSLVQSGSESLVNQSVVYPTQYIVAISLSILLYDYALTFCDEVNWIWKGSNKLTLITILFVLHRYFSILLAPALVVQYFWGSADPGRVLTCKALTSFHHVAVFLSQALMGAILIVRTYVLYGKNRLILICLCTIAMAVVGSATWGLVTAPSLAYRESQLPPRGCILPISLESIQSFMPAILLGMSAEVVVFVLTLYKSIQIIQKENSVVLRILLRDGALYFGVVMLANMAVIVSYYAFDDYSRGNVVTLTNSLYATLVSRLILNLRDPALSSDIHFRLYPFNYYAGSRIIRRGRGQTATGDIFTSVIMTYDGGTGDGSTPNEEEEGCSCSVCQESFEEYSGYPSTSLGRSGAYSGDSDARSMASMESSLSMQKERYCYAV